MASDISKLIKATMAKQAAEREAAARPTDERPIGTRTAAYGASLRDQIKAGKMTNAQAQALHNANVKQEMAKATQGRVPSGGPIDNRMGPGFGKPMEPSTPSRPNIFGPMTAPAGGSSSGFFGAPTKPPTSSQTVAPKNFVGPEGNSPSSFFGASKKPPSSTKFLGLSSSQTVAPNSPSMGGVKPGMSLAPTQTGSMAASGPMAAPAAAQRMKKGGTAKASKPVKKMAKGGSTASSRGDGCAVRGKTKGMMR